MHQNIRRQQPNVVQTPYGDMNAIITSKGVQLLAGTGSGDTEKIRIGQNAYYVQIQYVAGADGRLVMSRNREDMMIYNYSRRGRRNQIVKRKRLDIYERLRTVAQGYFDWNQSEHRVKMLQARKSEMNNLEWQISHSRKTMESAIERQAACREEIAALEAEIAANEVPTAQPPQETNAA